MSGGSLSMDDPPMRAHHHRYEPRNRGGLAVALSTADVFLANIAVKAPESARISISKGLLQEILRAK